MAAKVLRILLLIALYAALLSGGHWLGAHINAILSLETATWNQVALNGMILSVLLVYVVMTALPFVPGVEVGLALIMVLGTKIVAIVYLATVLSLLLAFGAGRLVPEQKLKKLCSRLGMERISHLLSEFSELDQSGRIQYIIVRAPKKWIPWILRHRFMTLAVLINLPGNALLGGGGGIAMLAGISRMITAPQFVGCILLAVAPLPLAVFLASWAGQ